MLPEIALEAFHFFDRTAVEGLQMHSRFLRDLINRHARSLPLRYINAVHVVYSRVIVLKDDRGGIVVEDLDEQELEKVFHQVNNAFIHRLALNFRRLALPLPYYLRANANGLQCQIGALRAEGTEAGIDYALIDFLGVQLKPQIYVTWMGHDQASIGRELFEDYVMLFKHNALRGSVKHLECELDGAMAAPDYIIPELFGVDVIGTCAITTKVDPLPWICKFIEMFETADRGQDIVRSVTLLHTRFGVLTPLHTTVGPLGEPRRTDAPTPHTAFIKEWSRKQHLLYGRTAVEATVAELFVFENAKTAKKLEVLTWTVEPGDGRSRLLGLTYAFLLQVAET